MKRLLSILVLLWCSLAYGQNTNDWINYSQRYYRIPITSEGVYKITYADLVSNGISVGDFDHRNLQIVHNGEVLPLFVSAQPDGIFRTSDYIEFYAKGGNDGWLDSRVYYSGKTFNDAISLYNDTAAYFLTIANTLESPRYDTSRVTNYDSYSPLQYCLKTIRSSYSSIFNETKASPYIMPAEGWCDNYFDMGGSTQKGIITANYADVDVPSKFSFCVGGFSETQHDIVVTLESDESFRWDTTYFDYAAICKSFTTQKALNPTSIVKFQSIGGDKTADKNCVAYLEVTYPCKLNFSNRTMFDFTLPEVEKGDYILLEITNFNAGSSAPVLYCPEIQKRILASYIDGKYKILVPNQHKELKCILASQNAQLHVSEIKPIKSKNSPYTNQFFDFTAESNQGDYIIITEKSLWSKALSYANYRQSTGKKVVLVDIDELYNQFAYGVRKHPVAIQAFIDYALNNWSVKPEHVFLIGKGFHLSAYRNNETMYARTLIPPMGNPASDLLYTMSVRGNSIKTKIAIGRLAAETPEEVQIYLNKVIDFESQAPSPWMKNIMHFGGGSTAVEQAMFKYYLNRYKSTLEGEYFGANVHSFFKESSDVYETTEPEAIRKYMNEGTAMLTFFGHASGSGFDQNIDHPSRFNNQGKYPLILANSCYSGDIFADNDYNVSRIWTYAENRGCIGFLANVDVGIPSYLNMFSSAFVRNIAYYNYGKSIGSSIAQTMTDLSGRNIIYEDLYDGIVGFTLQGDPAIKLHTFANPDFAVDESSLFFTPAMLTTDMEMVTFNVAIKNNGRAYSGNIPVKMVFTPAKGDSFELDTLFAGSYCCDTFAIQMSMKKFVSGEYTVSVVVDEENTITELSEENNVASISFFVSAQDVLPIYPQNYAIIPTDTVTLIASAVDPFNAPKEVVFELDTTETYDSPLFQTIQLPTGGKAIISWKPSIILDDSTTYFWRISAADSIKWNEASFTYEKGKSGWAQIHHHQFIDNDLKHLDYVDTTKKYSFMVVPHEIFIQTRGNCSTDKEYFECLYVQDATQMGISGFPLSSPALHIIVLDSASLNPWLSNKINYGQRNFSNNHRMLEFTANNVTSQKNIAKLFLDSVPSGNYIIGFSFKNPYCQSWDQSLKDAMDSLGFTAYKTTPDTYPYIFFTQKGNKSVCEEIVGTSEKDLIRFNKILYANHDEGNIHTENIGPAKQFEKVEWNVNKTEGDYTYLTLYSVSEDNTIYAFQNLFEPSRNRLDTLINTEYFPYMQLDCYMNDSTRTPADLNYWKVYYTPAVEFAVAPEDGFSFYSDSIQQGDSLRILSSIKNVSGTASDSVLVMYEIRNEQNELLYLSYDRIGAVNAFSNASAIQRIPTDNLSGNYTLKIEYNPVNPETGVYDQPEQIHFNNTYYYKFYVFTDETAPVIDVLVDGRHLLNGDNVSSKPDIKITVYDENKFYFLQDSNLVSISIVNLDTKETITYKTSDSAVMFIPAHNGEFLYTMYVCPTFTEPGIYELRVQACDESGNNASSQDYTVQFEISAEQKVSTLYNYPNPCGGFTTFRFVLSGTEKPEHVSISLYDIQGNFVRNIAIDNVHVGTNDVDVYWDGYDSHGLSLPNGIYFYQLHFDNKDSWKNLNMKQTVGLNKNCGKMILQR